MENEKTLNRLDFIKKNIFNVTMGFFKSEKNLVIAKCNLGLNNVKLLSNVKEIDSIKDKFEFVIIKLDDIELKEFEIILPKLKNILEVKGKIVILASNCFGIKYFCGGNYSKDTNIFDSIVKHNIGIGRKKLEYELKNAGYMNYKFYYPFPDYEYTNVIFSDEMLPDENMSKLLYNLHYNEGSRVLFDEHNALKNVIYNDEFTTFANSFMVIIDSSNDEKFKFASFNNLRKEEYRLSTVMYNDYVKKTVASSTSQSHIERIKKNIDILKSLDFNLLDYYDENAIYSKYVKNITVNEYVVEMLKIKGVEAALKIINDWNIYVSNKLLTNNNDNANNIFDKFGIDLKEEMLNKLHFTPYGFIDMVFENTFIIENKLYFYDQEWYYENVPIEFILYRAVNNLYLYYEKIEEKITLDEMLERLNLLEYKEVFDELEKCLQKEINDEDIRIAYGDFYSHYYNIEERENIIKIQNEAIIAKDKELSRIKNRTVIEKIKDIINPQKD